VLEQLRDYAHTHRKAVYMLLRHYLALDRPLLLQSSLSSLMQINVFYGLEGRGPREKRKLER